MRWAWPLLVAACVTPISGVARRSELVLLCTPSDAEVQLDGVPQGTCADFSGAPRGLALGSGARRIEVVKPGFEKWQRWLDADHTRVVMNVTLIANGESAP